VAAVTIATVPGIRSSRRATWGRTVRDGPGGACGSIPARRYRCARSARSIRIEAFGDLHETTLGAALTDEEARKLI